MASTGHRHAKRARPGLAADSQGSISDSSSTHSYSQDWASLSAGPAELIAERALANDVADYIRFRAVCKSWRTCSADPRASGVSDRRFHPRRWIMLRSAGTACNLRHRRCCFLNVSTGERIRVRVPDCDIAVSIVGGLLVLWRTHVVQLLNPLTGQLTDFPPLAEPPFSLFGGGLANDSTAVFVCNARALDAAKPGDEDWTRVTTDDYIFLTLPFAGRVYCVTTKNILVMENAAANQKPQLVVIAELKLEGGFCWTNDYLYPVYDEGGLILVHRRVSDCCYSWFKDKFAAYRVQLDTGGLEPMCDLAEQTLFVCGGRSLSVAARISSSIRADTIYVCRNDPDEEDEPKVIAFDLSGISTKLEKEDVPNYLFHYVCS